MSKSESARAFDEAARLYVQYLPVVQEMERAFLLSVDKFWSNVRQAVDDRSAPLRVDDEDQNRWRLWWLSKKKNAPEEVPYLWFYHRKTEIVIPGQAEFTVNIVPGAKSLRPEVEKALCSLELPSCCNQKRKAAEGGIATYLISYGKSVQPVEDVAEALVLILKAIEPFKQLAP
jgi:hypothetical protein